MSDLADPEGKTQEEGRPTMSWEPEMEELKRRVELAKRMGGPDNVRLDGYPVGILANDPKFHGGALTADGSEKMTRFASRPPTGVSWTPPRIVRN